MISGCGPNSVGSGPARAGGFIDEPPISVYRRNFPISPAPGDLFYRRKIGAHPARFRQNDRIDGAAQIQLAPGLRERADGGWRFREEARGWLAAALITVVNGENGPRKTLQSTV
jgi:hypothetical protein